MNISLVPILVVGLFGLAFGSFATVLTKRVPRNISIITPNSMCEHCGTPIPGRNLIPILSYLLRRGKTSCCNSTISWQYPFIELMTTVLFILSYLIAGFRIELLAAFALAALTLPLVIIDIKEHRLPNPLTYAGFILGIVVSAAISIRQGNIRPTVDSLILALIASAFFLLLNILSRGGMGIGDVKLAAMLGALTSPFGWSIIGAGFVFAFVLGAIIGLLLLVFKKATRKTLIPFGPYMLIGVWIALIIGQDNCRLITSLWSLKN
jgi:leader peptidase (prepilin peptidase)/N-methyltransferase